MEVVYLCWLPERSVRHFNNFLPVSTNFFVTGVLNIIIKVYHDYHDMCLPGK